LSRRTGRPAAINGEQLVPRPEDPLQQQLAEVLEVEDRLGTRFPVRGWCPAVALGLVRASDDTVVIAQLPVHRGERRRVGAQRKPRRREGKVSPLPVEVGDAKSIGHDGVQRAHAA
jgi:hypothetical protein